MARQIFQLAVIALKKILLNKSQPLDLIINAGFFLNLAPHRLFRCFTEFNSAADGVIIIFRIIGGKQNRAVFDDNRRRPQTKPPLIIGLKTNVVTYHFHRINCFHRPSFRSKMP